MSDVYAAWWHEASQGGGLQTALDASLLFQSVSPSSRVEVLAHERLGWVLAIDGRILHAEEDPGPREMLVHVPLAGHAGRMRRVLIVGGGDGAVLHETLKHPVEHVDVFEPEADIVKAADHLGFAGGLADPRAALHPTLPSGATWDAVLLARPLIPVTEAFALLAPGGVPVEWDLVLLTVKGPRWFRRNASVARPGHEQRYMTTSPILAGGFVGYSLHTHDPQLHDTPRTSLTGRHYNADLHRAAFALPAFWSELP